MNPISRLFIRLVIALILCSSLFASISGCAGGSDVGNPESFSFASDDTLLAYLVDQFAQSALPATLQAEKANDDMAAPAAPGESDYTQTNTQEAGVDESDQVKTNGRYLFVAADTHVDIVDTDAEGLMKRINQIDVDGHIDSLYLHADTLVTLYTPEDGIGNTWTGGAEI